MLYFNKYVINFYPKKVDAETSAARRLKIYLTFWMDV